jgi:prepilin-type N-terminal cleavage/methylation domain-containing protein
MEHAKRMRRGRGGFTLLELLLALVIVATALVGLGAAVSSGIASAAESINQRAAREACRAKLEGVITGSEPSGGGPIDGHDGFNWTVTKDEKTTGAADAPTEKYVVVTVTVTFPSDATQPSPSGSPSTTTTSPGQGTVKLVGMMDPPELTAK